MHPTEGWSATRWCGFAVTGTRYIHSGTRRWEKVLKEYPPQAQNPRVWSHHLPFMRSIRSSVIDLGGVGMPMAERAHTDVCRPRCRVALYRRRDIAKSGYPVGAAWADQYVCAAHGDVAAFAPHAGHPMP